MVDIFIIFRVQHFLGNKLRLFRVNSDFFITFRVHQVQIKKVTLNRNKNGGFRGAQRVEIGVLGSVTLGYVRFG